jgi:hypothetical protein
MLRCNKNVQKAEFGGNALPIGSAGRVFLLLDLAMAARPQLEPASNRYVYPLWINALQELHCRHYDHRGIIQGAGDDAISEFKPWNHRLAKAHGLGRAFGKVRYSGLITSVHLRKRPVSWRAAAAAGHRSRSAILRSRSGATSLIWTLRPRLFHPGYPGNAR